MQSMNVTRLNQRASQRASIEEYTRRPSRSRDSIDEGSVPPLQRELPSINSGAFENVCAQTLHPEKAATVMNELAIALNQAADLTESVRIDFSEEQKLIADEMKREFENQTDSAGRCAYLLKLIQFVTQNQAQSGLGSFTCSVINMEIVYVFSVCLATFIRESTAYSVELKLESLPEENQETVRLVVALLAASWPILLNCAGLLLDNRKGIGTVSSNVSKAMNIVMVVSSVCAAYATGTLTALAATLVGVNVYCGVRDPTQLIIKVDDGITEYKLKPVVFSASVYFFLEFFGSWWMSQHGPVGQFATHLSYTEMARHAAKRAGINNGIELPDTLVLRKSHCYMEGKSLVIKLASVGTNRDEVQEMVTGLLAGRNAMFISVLLIYASISTQFPDFGPDYKDLVGNAIFAALLEAVYPLLGGSAERNLFQGCTLF